MTQSIYLTFNPSFCLFWMWPGFAIIYKRKTLSLLHRDFEHILNWKSMSHIIFLKSTRSKKWIWRYLARKRNIRPNFLATPELNLLSWINITHVKTDTHHFLICKIVNIVPSFDSSWDWNYFKAIFEPQTAFFHIFTSKLV